MRQFDLTAVISDTNTPLTSFNSDYHLELYYSPREISPIIDGNNNVQLPNGMAAVGNKSVPPMAAAAKINSAYMRT